jgi:lipoprotein-anchoring transpeptidase ErfK/SrfK
VSNGCVRMLTPHVRRLFELVEVGTPVLVQR